MRGAHVTTEMGLRSACECFQRRFPVAWIVVTTPVVTVDQTHQIAIGVNRSLEFASDHLSHVFRSKSHRHPAVRFGCIRQICSRHCGFALHNRAR